MFSINLQTEHCLGQRANFYIFTLIAVAEDFHTSDFVRKLIIITDGKF